MSCLLVSNSKTKRQSFILINTKMEQHLLNFIEKSESANAGSYVSQTFDECNKKLKIAKDNKNKT